MADTIPKSSEARWEFGKNLLTYMDYRAFLRDYFEARKKARKGFSYRSFAQLAGFRSHSFCDKVIRGDRNLTLESALRIAKAIKLPKLSVEYFQSLVLYNQARTFIEKREYFEALQVLRKKVDFYRIQEDQYPYFSGWHHQVIRELAVFGNWKGDYRHLGRMLVPPLSEKEAEESVALLLRTGLLAKASGGRFIQANPVVSGQGCPPHIIKNVRTQFILKAIEAGERMSKTERHLSYATVAISEEDFREISDMMNDFLKRVLAMAVATVEVEKVYSLNLQLYPLTSDIRMPPGAGNDVK